MQVRGKDSIVGCFWNTCCYIASVVCFRGDFESCLLFCCWRFSQTTTFRILFKMKFSSAFLYVMSSLGVAQAAKPPYFILTGDSTVAVNGGWGDGFLADLKSPASGVNSGKSGATIPSFRAEGRWNTAIEAVKSQKGAHEAIVTIQFGHNDQKTYTLEQYSNNLVGLVNEVKAAGGTPVSIPSEFQRRYTNKVDRHHISHPPYLQRRPRC